MSSNHLSHFDLRVTDMEKALPFHSKVLPEPGASPLHGSDGLPGFGRRHHSAAWKVFAGDRVLPSTSCFGITGKPGHRPNGNRIAFRVESGQEVDRLCRLIRSAGALNIEGPETCPEHSATDCAVFFEDPCGNRLEIVHRTT